MIFLFYFKLRHSTNADFTHDCFANLFRLKIYYFVFFYIDTENGNSLNSDNEY